MRAIRSFPFCFEVLPECLQFSSELVFLSSRLSPRNYCSVNCLPRAGIRPTKGVGLSCTRLDSQPPTSNTDVDSLGTHKGRDIHNCHIFSLTILCCYLCPAVLNFSPRTTRMTPVLFLTLLGIRGSTFLLLVFPWGLLGFPF